MLVIVDVLRYMRFFSLQSSNFTYDPSDLAEINHDVLFREGENMRVRMFRRDKNFLWSLLFVTYDIREKMC